MVPERFSEIVGELENAGSATSSERVFLDRTYDLDNTGRFISGIAAAKQAVYKILKTQRFRFPVYSSDYGIETEDLHGCDPQYACIELERRIKDALSVLVSDGRIVGISKFNFGVKKSPFGAGSELFATFTVETNGGAFVIENVSVGGEFDV